MDGFLANTPKCLASETSQQLAAPACIGPTILNRPNSRFFRREQLGRAKAYYDRCRAITVTTAHFMPNLRTFAPIVAGAIAMEFEIFVLYNLLRALFWGIAVIVAGFLIGYFFGNVPGLDRYFTPLLLVVMFVSALPAMIIHWPPPCGNTEKKLQSHYRPRPPATKAAYALKGSDIANQEKERVPGRLDPSRARIRSLPFRS